MEHKDVIIQVNGSPIAVSNLEEGRIIVEAGRHYFYYKGKKYGMNIVSKGTKAYKLKQGGYTYEVEVKDELDLLVDKLGFNNKEEVAAKSIKAPMPGLVLDIRVSEGEQFEKGHSMIILEAMKMENILKSEGSGEVGEIMVKIGDKVEKGQILIHVK